MKKLISVLVLLVMIFVSVGVSPIASADSPKKISLSKTSKTVYIGQKYKLKVKSVTPKKADTSVKWKTSDKKIASITSDGVVEGKKKGTVTITAVSKSNSKIKAKCKVTIKKFKKTSIDYKSKIISDNKRTGYVLPDASKKNSDPHIIKTYTQLKALKKRIKKTYDISSFYNDAQTNPWYHNEKFAEGCLGDEILEELDKYDKEFFSKNALYYNCIEYSTKGMRADFSHKCTSVKKNISSSGKLTLYMNIRRSVKKTYSKTACGAKVDENYMDHDSFAFFITLNKKDISGVQDNKLKHYEYFEPEFLDTYMDVADN